MLVRVVGSPRECLLFIKVEATAACCGPTFLYSLAR